MTAREQATLNFYSWEYRHRGYYHFCTPVDIEVPYIPFRHATYEHTPKEDDGRVPSLFKRVTKLLGTPKEDTPQEEVTEFEPHFLAYDRVPNLVGVSLSFPRDVEIQAHRNIEFLNMLSFTEHPLSFEIVGTSDKMRIQLVCSEQDKKRVQSHLQAYFPNVIIRDTDITDFGFYPEQDIAIADFGLNDEYMRNIATVDSFTIDPLTSIIAIMDSLGADDVAVFQILFKGISSPLARDISYSVSDGAGGSFFADAPEMLNCAKEKIANPLFSVVIRIATQSSNNQKSLSLAQELAKSITTISTSQYNKLIPLSNEGYRYDFHKYNLYNRLSNRLGFILNTGELNTFLHYPNKTIVSKNLLGFGKTKQAPRETFNQKYVLGINEHEGEQQLVGIDDEIFSKHVVIGGATGTGKSHLVKQFIYQDVHNATFVLDPHGDLVIDILQTTPLERKDDVVYINLADQHYSFGFNIFSATTDAEKNVLASDLTSAFADTWISTGDRIQSVLQKTISTFIYSKKEASILDMKRFLLEEDFRAEFLQSLDDPVLHYYWENEFPLVRRNELSPLLLRIDSFMQTRLLRNIFCQTKGIDFRELIEQRKLVLIQLSVGLIGLENSKFIARLIISKINQIAFSRQVLSIENRLPIHLYIDESHNYANSLVIEQILSGARKYNLNLVLVLQHLEQMRSDLLNSVLTNTATQIFFRQSDKDARRVSQSFSFFEAEDFMELDRGEALVRVNKRSNDFNLKTLPLKQSKNSEEIQQYIIQSSQNKYAKSTDEIPELLKTLLPQKRKASKNEIKNTSKKDSVPREKLNIELQQKPVATSTLDSEVEDQKKEYENRLQKQEQTRKHRAIQDFIHSIAIQRGFKSVIEESTNDGGRVDIGLTKNNIRIAIEISVTNTKDYETQNIIKCIEAEYSHIAIVSESKVHLNNIKKNVKQEVSSKDFIRLHFFKQDEVATFLDSFNDIPKEQSKRIQGYRVTTSYRDESGVKKLNKQQELTNLILSSLRIKKDKK